MARGSQKCILYRYMLAIPYQSCRIIFCDSTPVKSKSLRSILSLNLGWPQGCPSTQALRQVIPVKHLVAAIPFQEMSITDHTWVNSIDHGFLLLAVAMTAYWLSLTPEVPISRSPVVVPQYRQDSHLWRTCLTSSWRRCCETQFCTI